MVITNAARKTLSDGHLETGYETYSVELLLDEMRLSSFMFVGVELVRRAEADPELAKSTIIPALIAQKVNMALVNDCLFKMAHDIPSLLPVILEHGALAPLMGVLFPNYVNARDDLTLQQKAALTLTVMPQPYKSMNATTHASNIQIHSAMKGLSTTDIRKAFVSAVAKLTPDFPKGFLDASITTETHEKLDGRGRARSQKSGTEYRFTLNLRPKIAG